MKHRACRKSGGPCPLFSKTAYSKLARFQVLEILGKRKEGCERTMSQAYCGYSLREISLNGDRFLLTIPPVHVWNQLMEFYDRGIVDIKQWERECNAFLFGENANTGDISVISNNHNTTVCCYPRGKTPEDGFLSAVEMKFWPCLVPLTRTGQVDDSFRSMDGQMMEGGFLKLGRPIMKKTSSAIVGWSDHPAVWAFHHYKELDLLDTCDDPTLKPLRWCVCNGLLMGMQALVQIDLRQLIKFGMVPY